MAFRRLSALMVALGVLTGCASTQPEAPQSYDLSIIHINDHHSHLVPKQRVIPWGGQDWQVESGGFTRVAAEVKQLRMQHDNVLTLHAGDATTGSLFFKLFGGEVDAKAMNQLCFDAFTIGNHEFDRGDQGLRDFLDQLGTPTCPTAVLSANVKPELGVSPLTKVSTNESFSPYTIIERDGQRLGIIGLTVAERTKKTSKPDATTEFEEELTAARRAVEQVRAEGVEKIILLTHIQYQKDLEIIEHLPAIDVVIGGDSHTLLGDFADYGLDSKGPYPTVLNNAEGNTVCLAHAYRYSQVVGELNVRFTGDDIQSCGGRPHFLLGTDIQPTEGAVTTVKPVKDALRASGVFTFIDPDPQMSALIAPYAQRVKAYSTETLATVPQTICDQQVHQPRRSGCGNGVSSGTHRLTAEAFLHAVPEADFAIQNGSSIRGDIKAGKFTRGDAFELLPYGNKLVKINISGSELKQVLEEAVGHTVGENASPGAYPYGAGIRYVIDLTQNFGDRVAQIEIKDKESGEWQAVRPRDNYTVVTNSFIAGGQEGYVTFYSLSQRGRAEETEIDYADAMVNYAKSLGVLKRPKQFATQAYNH